MKKLNHNYIIAILIILISAVLRVIMYPNNFSSIIAMALFAGAIFTNKKYAYAMPILAMFISDVLFEVSGKAQGFWGWGQLVNYGILVLITVFAFSLKKINVISVAGYSISASLFFFVLSNLSFFLIDNQIYHLYSQNLKGFVQCYIAALPFLKNSLIADLFYSILLFGSYYFITSSSFKKELA